MLSDLSDETIDARIASLERMIASESDWKSIPAMSRLLEKLFDEQSRREFELGGDRSCHAT